MMPGNHGTFRMVLIPTDISLRDEKRYSHTSQPFSSRAVAFILHRKGGATISSQTIMKISNLFQEKKCVISFEVFPPKPTSPFATVLEAVEALHVLKPDFISVTYGAGGSTHNKTLELAHHIKNELGIEALAHLTCISNSEEETENILNKLTELNLENILALRGDPPKDSPLACRNIHAVDLMRQINSRHQFCIAGAAYPEGHPEAPTREQDLLFLKEKVAAGAEFLITQIAFDNDYLKSFRDKANHAGIDIPLSVGIMPVFSAAQITHISSLCGAILPKAIQDMLDKYSHNQDALQSAGIEYACKQIDDLIANDFQGIHIYTMNRPLLARAILSGTNLR